MYIVNYKIKDKDKGMYIVDYKIKDKDSKIKGCIL